MQVLNEGALLAKRYTLIRRLGAGGMAEIWLANDRQSGAPVALKFLSAELAANQAHRDLFRREWRLSASLMHAHIVRVFEYHDDPDGPFYSLQYLGSADLGVVSGQSPDIALRPVGLIADALRYAHAKGVVHRDIKASNVLLDANGAPYLVDFGIAAVTDGIQSAAGGTAFSASPQQLAGQPAQPADDIYALGLLLCELLTGQAFAHNAGGLSELKLADGSPAPTALTALIQDMLAEDVDARPSAETVGERLRDAGFAAGPVPSALLPAVPHAATETLDSVQAIKPVHRDARVADAIANIEVPSAGVSPTVLFGGLAAALLLFIGVIYGLPALVGPELPQTSVESDEELPLVAGDDTVLDEDSAEEQAPEAGGTDTPFSEIVRNSAGTEGTRIKAATDEALGDLLSRLERLRYRAIDRWGGQPYLDAVDVYAEGDAAYLSRNYALAGERYRRATEMLVPFFDGIDKIFADTLAAAKDAFAEPDPSEAVRLFDLAVAITPGHREAEAWLARARNLESVLDLTAQGESFERDLELNAAKLAFVKALELDAEWEPAAAGIRRVDIAIKQMSFDMRMTEGLEALARYDFPSARAAFEAAKLLEPSSPQPADGLLQVDQGIRLANIRRLEAEADALVQDEQWETAIAVYEEILGIDPDLSFAKTSLADARSRAALHNRLQGLIEAPDSLSDPANMQTATRLLLDVARITPMGPRLENQKLELSQLLKRAATPLRVQLISDNATDVSIFKVGKFGTFASQELELRPGVYVAVGIRPGFRDVRLEFRVAPEIEMQPIVVQCEERI